MRKYNRQHTQSMRKSCRQHTGSMRNYNRQYTQSMCKPVVLIYSPDMQGVLVYSPDVRGYSCSHQTCRGTRVLTRRAGVLVYSPDVQGYSCTHQTCGATPVLTRLAGVLVVPELRVGVDASAVHHILSAFAAAQQHREAIPARHLAGLQRTTNVQRHR